jgi:hypothetical protein
VDLFAILRSLKRHLTATVVTAALTLLAGVVVLFVLPKDYEARASYVLVNPPAAPTEAEIAEDPGLAVNRNNPYLRFGNQATVGQVLAGRVSGDSVREALMAQGADADYVISPSADFGASGLVMDIVGTGSSQRQAEDTLRLVVERMETELYEMQTVYGADDSALISALPVAEPPAARVLWSGTIRVLVGLGGAGVILLFTIISIAGPAPATTAPHRTWTSRAHRCPREPSSPTPRRGRLTRSSRAPRSPGRRRTVWTAGSEVARWSGDAGGYRWRVCSGRDRVPLNDPWSARSRTGCVASSRPSVVRAGEGSPSVTVEDRLPVVTRLLDHRCLGGRAGTNC